jgi:hypothetical protein
LYFVKEVVGDNFAFSCRFIRTTRLEEEGTLYGRQPLCLLVPPFGVHLVQRVRR